MVIALGGALGALSRYGLDRWAARFGSVFPLGTLLVNVLGSFALGLIAALAAAGRVPLLDQPDLRAGLTVGFLGALTTFSTFSGQTLEAWRLGNPGLALANVALNVTLALGACWFGLVAGDWLS